MTTKEAKTKMCPFISSTQYVYVPVVNGWAASIEKGETRTIKQNCICGDCMAWVYVKTHEQIENKASASDEKVCMSRYSDGAELPEDQKEGICMRLSR